MDTPAHAPPPAVDTVAGMTYHQVALDLQRELLQLLGTAPEARPATAMDPAAGSLQAVIAAACAIVAPSPDARALVSLQDRMDLLAAWEPLIRPNHPLALSVAEHALNANALQVASQILAWLEPAEYTQPWLRYCAAAARARLHVKLAGGNAGALRAELLAAWHALEAPPDPTRLRTALYLADLGAAADAAGLLGPLLGAESLTAAEHLLLAQLAGRLGRPEATHRHCAVACRKGYPPRLALLHVARDLVRHRGFPLAQELLDDVVRAESMVLERCRSSGAREVAAAAAPGDLDLLFQIAHVATLLGRYDLAGPVLAVTYEAPAHRASSIAFQALIARETWQLDAALQLFGMLAQSTTPDAATAFVRLLLLTLQGQSATRDQIQQAIGAAPRTPATLLEPAALLSWTLREHGFIEDARRHASAPGNSVFSQINAAITCAAAGRESEAAAWLRPVIGTPPAVAPDGAWLPAATAAALVDRFAATCPLVMPPFSLLLNVMALRLQWPRRPWSDILPAWYARHVGGWRHAPGGALLPAEV